MYYMMLFPWVRWVFCGIFLAFGIWSIVRRRYFDFDDYFETMGLGQAIQPRVVAAYKTRVEIERPASEAMTAIVGGVFIVSAALIAFTRIPLPLIYSAAFLLAGIVVLDSYTKVRTTSVRRFASLKARDGAILAPKREWVFAGVTALVPLFWIASMPFASIATTVAGIAILIVARRVIAIPSLLPGNDIAAETFVDEHLRAFRGWAFLYGAIGPAFQFVELTGPGPGHSWARLIAAFVPPIVLFVLLLRRRDVLTPPTKAQATSWFNVAS